MSQLIALLCRLTIAVAATILDTVEPHYHPHIDDPLPNDFAAWTAEMNYTQEDE